MLYFRKYDQVGSVLAITFFQKIFLGRHHLVEKSLSKVPGKELKKTKPRKPVVKKVPKQKPRIDGPVFSQSPIPMKKVKLGGRQKKTTNFLSKDEEDGGLGLDGRLEGGGYPGKVLVIFFISFVHILSLFVGGQTFWRSSTP